MSKGVDGLTDQFRNIRYRLYWDYTSIYKNANDSVEEAIKLFVEKAKTYAYENQYEFLLRYIYMFANSLKSGCSYSKQECGKILSEKFSHDDLFFTTDDAYLYCYFVYELFTRLESCLPELSKPDSNDSEQDKTGSTKIACERVYGCPEKITFLNSVANITWLPSFFEKVVRLLKQDNKFYDFAGYEYGYRYERQDFVAFFAEMCEKISDGLVVFNQSYDGFNFLGDNGFSWFVEEINNLNEKLKGPSKAIGKREPDMSQSN